MSEANRDKKAVASYRPSSNMSQTPFATLLAKVRRFAARIAAWLVLRHSRGYSLSTRVRFEALYLLRRPHEPDFLALHQLIRQRGPVVVDVGANVGQSILSLLTVLPTAEIVSFEPNPLVLPRLRKLASRFSQVSVLPFGLADRTEDAELYVPVYRGTFLTGLASFDRAAAGHWLTSDRMVGFHEPSLRFKTFTLPLRRLDDWQLEPQLLKIDVQGLEPAVIRGALGIIERSRPVVMAEHIEFGSEAHLTLEPLHYRLAEFHNGTFTLVSEGSSIRRVNQFLIPEELLRGVTLAGC